MSATEGTLRRRTLEGGWVDEEGHWRFAHAEAHLDGGLVLALAALFGLPNVAFAAPVTASTNGLDPATITVIANGEDNQISISDTTTYGDP